MSNISFTPQEIEQFLQQFFDVVGARQYIGARYVPIFGRAGSDTVEWDDLAPYEPLTVVMHDGVSYVSRRYVPAGIEITDTDYWVETYRFNAQVEQYRQEVLSFQDEIDDRIPFPDPVYYPKFGTLGQVLSTLADGTVKWQDPVVPSDEQAEEVITAWLDDHPEATTTVQDGAITTPKLQDGAVTFDKLNQYVRADVEGSSIWPSQPTRHNVTYPLIQGYWQAPNNFADLDTLVTTKVLIHVPKGYELHMTVNNKYVVANSYDVDGTPKSTLATLDRINQKALSYSLISAGEELIFISCAADYYIGLGIAANASHTAEIIPSDVQLSLWLEQPTENMLDQMPSTALAETLANVTSVTPTATNDNFVLDFYGGGIADSSNTYRLNRFVLDTTKLYVLDVPATNGTFAAAAIKSSNTGTAFTTIGEVLEPGTYLFKPQQGKNVVFIVTPKTQATSPVHVVSAISDITGLTGIFYGLVYAYIDGTRTLHVRPLANTRYAYNGLFYSLTDADVTFPLEANHVYGLKLAQTGFECVDAPQIGKSDNLLAIVYANAFNVVSQNKYVLCNEIPLLPMYQRATIPVFINNDKLKGYDIFPQAGGTLYGRFFSWTDVFNTNVARIVTDDSYMVVDSSLRFTQNQTSIDGKKILCIGDSFTARGWYQERLLTHNSTLQFLGTRQCQYSTLMGEGYSGTKANQVLVNPTITPYGEQSITNPFYDPALQKCTLEYYCRTQNVSPDYIVIGFGLNETFMESYYPAMQNFIDTCISYNPSVKVYVMQMPLMVQQVGSLNKDSANMVQEQRKCWQAAQHLTNATPIPCRFIMVDELDYNITTTPYPYGNKTVDVASDGVHPGETTGFAKLGDMIFNYLGM